MNLDWLLDPVTKHYVDFTGRATRQQYWMFFLYYFIFYVVVVIAGALADLPEIVTFYTLGLLLPNIALATRRLHDINKSGWWQLVAIIPLLGWIILIIFLARKGDTGTNDYGENTSSNSKQTDSSSAGVVNTQVNTQAVPRPDDPVNN